MKLKSLASALALSLLAGTARADSYAEWQGSSGATAWTIDSPFRAENVGAFTYVKTGGWYWDSGSFYAYFGVQANPTPEEGKAIFSIFGPPEAVQGERAADNGAGGIVACNQDTVGTAEGVNTSCIVSGFPWKENTWYVARIWPYGSRTHNGIAQEHWGYWLRELDEAGNLVEERWVASFWVPAAWGQIPIDTWGQFAETYAALPEAAQGGLGGCCYQGKVLPACANPLAVPEVGNYYFAPPVPDLNPAAALAPISRELLISTCATGTEILAGPYHGREPVQMIPHGRLNYAWWQLLAYQLDNCADVGVFTPQCQFYCAAGDTSGLPHCDGVCGLADDAGSADCNGVCGGSDVSGSPDCPTTTTSSTSSTTTTTTTTSSSSTTTTTLPTEFTCPAAMRTNCAGAKQAKFQYNEKKPGKEKMSMQWRSFGQAPPVPDLGDPVTGDTKVAVCIYDDAETLVAQLMVDRAGQTCGAKPCWVAKGSTAYGYKDGEGGADGISSLEYPQIVTGEYRSKAAAKGSNNATKGQSALPVGVVAALAGSVSPTVQLHTSAGFCVSADYFSVTRDDGRQFQARQ